MGNRFSKNRYSDFGREREDAEDENTLDPELKPLQKSIDQELEANHKIQKFERKPLKEIIIPSPSPQNQLDDQCDLCGRYVSNLITHLREKHPEVYLKMTSIFHS